MQRLATWAVVLPLLLVATGVRGDEPWIDPLVLPTSASRTVEPAPQPGAAPSAAAPSTGGLLPYSERSAPPTVYSRMSGVPVWDMYTDWSFRGGNQRVLGDGMVFVPLWQDGTSLLFADVRGQTDDQENYEGNWGLGLRSLVDGGWLVGGYGFYDLRRSETKNVFHQATFGVEAMSVDFEARVNGYVPDMTGQAVPRSGGGGPTGVVVSNGTIVIRSGGEAVERAYAGMDAEIGALLKDWVGGDVELRGFVGGYWFDTYADGYPEIAGPRVRFELRTYDLEALGGAGSRVTLGVDYQWDEVRDDQVFASLQVRIPLGPRQNRFRPLGRLERRMLDRIVRDIDIVSTSRGDGFREEQALDPLTSQPYTSVVVVDAETDDVPAAVAAAGPNSTVVVDGSKGQLDTTATIVVQDGQTLKGGGFEVEGAQSGTRMTFGTRPTVHQTDANQDVIVVASNSTVRDIDVTGGRTGITDGGTDRTNVTILDNTVTGASNYGFQFGNFDGTLQGNTASQSAYDGFYLNSASSGTEIRDNTATNNGGFGFLVDSLYAGSLFDGNTSSGNGSYGFYTFWNEGTISNNTASDNGGYGFLSYWQDSGATFSGNTSTGNSGIGIYLDEVRGSVTDNLAEGNGSDGFRSFFLEPGSVFRDNESNDNGGRGYRVLINIGGSVSGNTGSGNSGGGNTYP